MKITLLKAQQKDPNRVSIFVDSAYAFSLTMDELLQEKLKKGLDLDQAQLNRLKKVSADGKLKLRAQTWLLNRPRSTREFTDYLRRKKIDDDTIEALLLHFKKIDVLNDQRFATWWYEFRSRSGRSERRVAAELYQKGVAKELVAQVLGGSDELVRLRSLVAKKRKQIRYQDKQKLMQYLIRQGYAYSSVKLVVAEE